MEDYKPTGLRRLKHGKYPGNSLENLMFKDYLYLCRLFGHISKDPYKHEFHFHLNWLLERGDDRQTVALCPFCQQEKVKYFSAIEKEDSLSIGRIQISISCEECKDKLGNLIPKSKKVKAVPFRFSVLKEFRSKKDREAVVNIFLLAFALSGQRRTSDVLFKFFSDPGVPSTISKV